jgi:hypothetical protein
MKEAAAFPLSGILMHTEIGGRLKKSYIVLWGIVLF